MAGQWFAYWVSCGGIPESDSSIAACRCEKSERVKGDTPGCISVAKQWAEDELSRVYVPHVYGAVVTAAGQKASVCAEGVQ